MLAINKVKNPIPMLKSSQLFISFKESTVLLEKIIYFIVEQKYLEIYFICYFYTLVLFFLY